MEGLPDRHGPSLCSRKEREIVVAEEILAARLGVWIEEMGVQNGCAGALNYIYDGSVFGLSALDCRVTQSYQDDAGLRSAGAHKWI